MILYLSGPISRGFSIPNPVRGTLSSDLHPISLTRPYWRAAERAAALAAAAHRKRHADTCTCLNGEPARIYSRPNRCHSPYQPNCATCDPGFYLKPTPKKELKSMNLGFKANLHLRSYFCESKQCSCTNGIPAQNINCPKDGQHVCDYCDPGYSLTEDYKCEKNVCKCKHGVPVEGTQTLIQTRIQPSCRCSYYSYDRGHSHGHSPLFRTLIV